MWGTEIQTAIYGLCGHLKLRLVVVVAAAVFFLSFSSSTTTTTITTITTTATATDLSFPFILFYQPITGSADMYL